MHCLHLKHVIGLAGHYVLLIARILAEECGGTHSTGSCKTGRDVLPDCVLGLSLATWNVRTSIGHTGQQLNLIAQDLCNLRVEICALQETRRQTTETLDVNGFLFLFSPADSKGNRGCGIALRKKYADLITDWQAINDRLCFIQLKFNSITLEIFSAHAPTESAPDYMKEAFYSELYSRLRKQKKGTFSFILGDFNADISRWSKSTNMSNNAFLLQDFLVHRQLRVANFCFKHKRSQRVSYRFLRSRSWHTYDLALVNKSAVSLIRDCRSCSTFNTVSDHRLVKLRISLQPPPTRKHRPKLHLNSASLREINTNKKFLETLQTLVDPEESFQVNSRNIWTAASSVCQRKKPFIGWYEESKAALQPLIRKKVTSFHQYRISPSAAHKNAYLQDKRTSNDAVAAAKTDWLSRLAEKVQKGFHDKNFREIYQSLPRLRDNTGYSRAPFLSKGKCLAVDQNACAKTFADHFNKTLNCNPPNFSPLDVKGLYLPPSQDEISQLDALPTDAELADAINALHFNKAAGPDDLTAEMWRCGSEITFSLLRREIDRVWSLESVSSIWTESIILPIFKKGDRSDPANYRPISLLNVSGSTLTYIINKRLKTFMEPRLSESQYGFRANRSTQDLIFSLRQLQEHAIEWNKPLFALFIDFSQAFDSLDRSDLFRILRDIGIPDRIVNILASLHSDTFAKVRIGNSFSDIFQTHTGVRQGCKIAPLLFTIHLDVVLKIVMKSVLAQRFSIVNLKSWNNSTAPPSTNVSIAELLYADDTTFVSESENFLQQVLNSLNRHGRAVGLRINALKTVRMTLNSRYQFSQPLFLDTQEISSVIFFKFLGSIFTIDGSLNTEVSERIKSAAKCRGRLFQLWRSNLISTEAKIAVFKSTVLAVLLYSAESWTVLASHLAHIQAFVTQSLRLILNISWTEHQTVTELYSRCKIALPSKIIQLKRLRFFGHLCRMPPTHLPQICFLQRYKGPRPSHGTRKRWRSLIAEDITTIPATDSEVVTLALDRKKWRSILPKTSFPNERSNLPTTTVLNTSSCTNKHTCPIKSCGRICRSGAGLASHLKKHASAGEHPPSTFFFSSKTPFSRQQTTSSSSSSSSSTTSSDKHVCPIDSCRRICGSGAGLASHLRAHERASTPLDNSLSVSSNYPLNEVPALSSDSDLSSDEQLSTNNNNKLPCPLPGCTFSTTTTKLLDRHRQLFHQLPSDRLLEPDKANKIINARAAHVQCPICGLKSTKSGLTRHICRG